MIIWLFMLLMLHFLPTTSHTKTPTVFSTMLIFHFWFSVCINHSDHPHHSPPLHIFHLQPTTPPPIARIHAMGAVQYIDGKSLRRPAKTGDLDGFRSRWVGWEVAFSVRFGEVTWQKKTGGGLWKMGSNWVLQKWNSWAFEFHFVSPPWGWQGFVYVKP